MSVFTVNDTMLYCPKCQQTYKAGSQRFCSNEGERLLPALTENSAINTGDVFSDFPVENSLNQTKGETRQTSPKPGKIELHPGFSPPPTSKIFKTEKELNSQNESKTFAPKASPRIIKPSEIPFSQARLGDRKTDPNGREALTRDNTEVLIGQTIRGRYHVTENLGEDENSLVFLAEDKIVSGKKVLVKVLMDEEAQDDFIQKLFAEERVSLSHIDHPNVENVVDSGELPEGKPFIVAEYIEGKSVKDILGENGQFDALRAARIIRQAAAALGEVHNNGIVHRNLLPENIILTTSENGTEQVKLINFGISKGELNKENLSYKSPEQIERKPSAFGGDIYSLAVIAYQMLTNRLPFQANSKKNLVRAQREGLLLLPSDLRFDLSPLTDGVLEKALAFDSAERFAKARDFGDAFFNALQQTENNVGKIEAFESVSNKEAAATKDTENPARVKIFEVVSDDKSKTENALVGSETNTQSDVSTVEAFDKAEEKISERDVKSVKDLAWEKRSPEPPKAAGAGWNILSFLSVALLLAALGGIWYYFINRTSEPVHPTIENVAPVQQPSANVSQPETNIAPNTSAPPEEIETPPLPRQISQPPDTNFFENSKENLKGNLLQNFLGFSLYYPKSWTQNKTNDEFLDVSKKTAGLPIEQILVGYYKSDGTFQTDKERFPKLVEKSNKDLKKIIPNYQTFSEGEIEINGWKVYEIKFQGGGKTEKGEKKMTLWGRRLWIPAQRPGMKSGYVVTMLATSLSREVKSVEDVGVKGDLATVLETFEPNQNF